MAQMMQKWLTLLVCFIVLGTGLFAEFHNGQHEHSSSDEVNSSLFVTNGDVGILSSEVHKESCAICWVLTSSSLRQKALANRIEFGFDLSSKIILKPNTCYLKGYERTPAYFSNGCRAPPYYS